MPHVERRDLTTWRDSDWARCYALHVHAHREQGTTARSLDAYRAAQIAAANGQPGARSWIAREGDHIIGNLALTSSAAVPGLAVLNLYVHPDARQRGVGRALVVAAMREAQSEGANLLEVTTMQPDSWRLCERLGGRLERVGTQLTLRLANANWPVVDAWCERGLQGSLLTSLREIEQLPEAIAGGFVELHNRVWADQPHAEHAGPPLTLDDRRAQELSYERLGWRWITLVSREPSGALSGMTDILYDPSQPDIIRQNFTGTLPGYRGRGLAKWLKASMLQLVRERFPAAQQITTNNAESNAAMLAINRQLGFNAAIQHRTYRFELARLRDALDAHAG